MLTEAAKTETEREVEQLSKEMVLQVEKKH